MERRPCPLCGSDRSHVAADIKPNVFCAANWSYRRDYASLLGVDANVGYAILRCDDCQFAYAAWVPSASFLETLYEVVIDQDACIAGSENPESYSRRLRYVATLLNLAGGASGTMNALDYGCGIGVTLRILRAVGFNALGFDPSVKRAVVGNASDVKITGDINDVTNASPFDVVVLDNVLEHLPDPVSVVQQLRQLTRKGSIVFVSVPSYENDRVEREAATVLHGARPDMTLNPWEHLGYFSLQNLDDLMRRAAFTRVRATLDIGLRNELRTSARIKNSLASIPRLLQFAATGRTVETVENAFYLRG